VDEAAVLHSGLVSAFEALLPVFDPASTFEHTQTHIVLTCPRLPLLQMNGIWLEGEDAPPLEELERTRAAIERRGVPFSLQARASLGSDVATIVDGLHLRLADSEPGMVVRPNELTTPPTPELEIERIADADSLPVALRLAADGFGVPLELFAPMYSVEVLSTAGVSIHVGRSRGEPVSTAVSYVVGDTVGIFNVATPERFRGRGFGSAVTQHACERAFAEGITLAWLQSATVESVYRRLGFRQVEMYLLYEPDHPTPYGS
jgi:ribosomal protein S18 acetylase RimI-like enzyme